MSSRKPKDEKVSGIAPFGLRMLPELKDRIAASAQASGRSMNAEIVHRLEASYEPNLSDAQSKGEFVETIAALSKQLENVDLVEWMNLMKQLNAKLGRADDDHQSLSDYANMKRQVVQKPAKNK